MMMKKILALLLCLLMMAPALAETTEAPAVLEMHQLNLGFADGYLIRLGEIDILIDGGEAVPTQPKGEVMAYLREVGVETLDVYIATHWHLDHAMNMNSVLAEFGTADTVVYGPSTQVYRDYEPLANGAYVQMATGDVIEIGEMTFYCVGPQKVENNGYRNQDSLNFVVQYGDWRMLFTGDFAASANINTLFPEIMKDIDVLKFPHHGNEPYSIGRQAMRTTRPDWVLVPGAVNKFRIWDLFDNAGAELPREQILTVADAPFVILTDGSTMQVRISDGTILTAK